MVDELTLRIKKSFNLTSEEIARDFNKEAGKITTNSPEALKYYMDARKYHNKGDYNQSIQLMKKAIAIDPEFALAYKGLASSYANLGYDSEERKNLKRALEFVNRVSDRERYLIEGDYYSLSEETLDKAIKAYNKLLELYPDDSTANINLAIMYRDLEEWDKSIERFEVLRKASAESIFPYSNLAIVHWYKGDYGKAEEVLKYYISHFSENVIINGILAFNYLFKGEYDNALAEVDKAISLDPTYYRNLYIKGDIYQIKGDLIEAEKEYQKLIETGENAGQFYGRDKLGALYLLQGKFTKSEDQAKLGIELAEKLGEKGEKSEFQLKLAYRYLKFGKLKEALEECNKAGNVAIEAKDIALQRSVLHFKGLVYLDMNSMDEVQKVSDELKKLSLKGLNRKVIRDYDHLMGMIELKRNVFSKAIKEFEKVLSLSSLQHSIIALYIDSIASAYYQAGDLDKARLEYERIISLTYGRLYYGDIYAKSFYMLGKIFQSEGLKEKALEHYKKFLNLWKEADRDFPEITDAKNQVAALQSP